MSQVLPLLTTAVLPPSPNRRSWVRRVVVSLVAVGLGYSQLLVATDAVRLYQWAAPVLALAAVAAVPAWALPIVALTVIFNPWKGPGI